MLEKNVLKTSLMMIARRINFKSEIRRIFSQLNKLVILQG
jgi:hypothetical protein